MPSPSPTHDAIARSGLEPQPTSTDTTTSFLAVPEATPEVQRLYDHDIDQLGYIMNLSHVWGHQPALHDGLFELMGVAVRTASLTFRQRGILVTACAGVLGDSYCALAWGGKLTAEADVAVARAALAGDDGPLDHQERALAAWARRVAREPNTTTTADLEPLRAAGYDDTQIFAITVFVGLRIAFAVVNDALGLLPDHALAHTAPPEVRELVTFGRPIATKHTG